MKRLPLLKTTPPLETKVAPIKKRGKARSSTLTLEKLKGMSNEELLLACQERGLSIPQFGDNTPGGIIHLHLLRLLKLHEGFATAEPKRSNSGRKPKLPTTLAIQDITQRQQRIETMIEEILQTLRAMQ
jgi:hypothetical protein